MNTSDDGQDKIFLTQAFEKIIRITAFSVGITTKNHLLRQFQICLLVLKKAL